MALANKRILKKTRRMKHNRYMADKNGMKNMQQPIQQSFWHWMLKKVAIKCNLEFGKVAKRFEEIFYSGKKTGCFSYVSFLLGVICILVYFSWVDEY